jgi:hypothetical protein
MFDEAYVFEKLSQCREKELERIMIYEDNTQKKYPFLCRFSLFKKMPACDCSQLNL